MLKAREMTQSTVVDTAGLSDAKAVQQLQDEAQLLLCNFMCRTRPDEPCRFGKLLLTVPCLRLIPTNAISALFFADVTSSVPMERIVTDIYRQLTTSATD